MTHFRLTHDDQLLGYSADRHVSSGSASFTGGARSPEHLRDWGKPPRMAAIRAKPPLTSQTICLVSTKHGLSALCCCRVTRTTSLKALSGPAHYAYCGN